MLFGGVLADRTSRQRVIGAAEFVAMVPQLVIAAIFVPKLFVLAVCEVRRMTSAAIGADRVS